MRILHYALGFPPYRSGGLTKFCCDLMDEQYKDGNEVALLWPGKFSVFSKSPQVVKRKNKGNIKNYELVNPLPVPLDEGILDIAFYMKTCDKNIFVDFLQKWKPDIIHVHTLMGIYKEFFEAAKQLKIRLLYTTHDYFGLCPMVTFYNREGICTQKECECCADCNANALSIGKIKLLQSHIYRNLKETSVVRNLRKRHKKMIQEKDDEIQVPLKKDKTSGLQYQALRKYYISMLDTVTFIHYNSSLTKMIYENYLHNKNGEVISISHKNISDNKKLRTYNDKKIRFLFLSPAKNYKGFFWLKRQFDELWKEGFHNFTLDTYCNYNGQEPYMNNHSNYVYADLENIFNDTDVLIVPSLWNETFGFTLLEALSFGVPVLASNHVGAKDLIAEYGLIFSTEDEAEFRLMIKNLNSETLSKWNKNIYHGFEVQNYAKFVNEIMKFYEE